MPPTARERSQLARLARHEEQLHDASLRATHVFPDGTTLLYLTAGPDDGQHLPARECMTLARPAQGAVVVQVESCGGHNPHQLRGPLWISAAGLHTTTGAVPASTALEGIRSYAVAYGLIGDPAIATVTMQLANGEETSVTVQDGAYLLAVPGESAPVAVLATNTNGAPVHQQRLR